MQPVSSDAFGPLVAYLVPGATVLLGFSPFSATLRGWFGAASDQAPTIGGFLYLTVAAFAVGMTVSALRWAVVDQLHARTGLPAPALDFSRLGPNVEGLRLLIHIHYNHYLFYSNMLVGTSIASLAYRTALGWTAAWGLQDAGVLVVLVLLFLASRDTLAKYYARSGQLLRAPAVRRGAK